jgi:hypothetical protein
MAASEFAHGIDAFRWSFDFGDIDGVVGSEAARHFKTVCGAADHDGLRGAGAFGNGERRDTDGTCALNDDGVAPLDASAFDAVNGGDERAAGADDRLGGEVIGSLKTLTPARR